MQSGNYGGYNSSIGQLLGGLFGNTGDAYKQAGNQYQNYFNQGIQAQNPFYQAGTGAIPGYQNWVNSMQDPSGFINKMMGQYQQSPWATYEQQQATRAGNNAASSSGLSGSTPFAQQMAQTSAGITSQDMQNWLGNVLGTNTQYGQGLGNQVGWGQNAANQMSNMYGNAAQWMGGSAFGQNAGNQMDQGNVLGGLLGIFGL